MVRITIESNKSVKLRKKNLHFKKYMLRRAHPKNQTRMKNISNHQVISILGH
jgi:hypothetical protein